MKVQWLGRVSYADALVLQERIVTGKIDDPRRADELLLLEHDPVFTIGRTPDRSSLRDAANLPAPVVATNRGGQATWHGPGQLVGYPLLDLRRRGSDLHRYLRMLEEFLIAVCRDAGIAARQREGLTGVWVAERKIASLGVGVRRWISMHGFALNVCGPLDGFAHITPCGISDVAMTSLEREGATGVSVDMIARRVALAFPAFFSE